jgi:hypothetical protein
MRAGAAAAGHRGGDRHGAGAVHNAASSRVGTAMRRAAVLALSVPVAPLPAQVTVTARPLPPLKVSGSCATWPSVTVALPSDDAERLAGGERWQRRRVRPSSARKASTKVRRCEAARRAWPCPPIGVEHCIGDAACADEVPLAAPAGGHAAGLLCLSGVARASARAGTARERIGKVNNRRDRSEKLFGGA